MCVQVYDVAIETIFLAFCYDCEAHGGHPQHAPQLLLSTVETRSMVGGRMSEWSKSVAPLTRSSEAHHHERSSEAHRDRRSGAQRERRSEAQYEYNA